MAHILLIDVAHLFYTSWHATTDQEVSAAFTKTLERVAWVRSQVQHDHCAICCDWGPYWRHELSGGTYKAQRLKPSEAMLDQYARVRERLARDGLLVWRVQGFEADDLIGTATARYCADGHEVTIATGDKDLMQCVGETCQLFNTNSGTMFNAAGVREKFGVPPEQIADWLALCGDSSDNVKGIPSVGPKKAAVLLELFGNGTAAIHAAAEGDMRIPKAVTAALNEHWQNYALALALVSLRTDVPLDFDELFQERKPQTLTKEKPRDMSDDDDEELISGPPQRTPSEPPAAAPAPRQTTALATVPAYSGFEMSLEPRNMGQAWSLAQTLFDSRLYQRFGNAEAIMAVVMRGREMGLGALTALDCFHMIEGKPSPHAHLLVSRSKMHPDCEYFQLVDTNGIAATYETKNRRNPRPTKLTYTIEQARAAGLCPLVMRPPPESGKDSRGNWEKRPDEMLRKTCAVQLARIEYPEATLGLTAFEELE